MVSDGVLGVVSAVIGSLAMVLVARIGVTRRPAVEGPAELEDDRSPALEVSPEIWVHMSGEISALKGKVDRLTELVEAQTVRVTTLERLLRQAMKLLRSAHRQLRAVGTEPDQQVPTELIPYSID